MKIINVFKIISILLVVYLSNAAKAQEINYDTLFFANGLKVSSPEGADAFKIITYFDTIFQKVYERIYAIEGNLIEETHYSNFRMDEMDLFHREFFNNRKVYKHIGYAKGKLHGKFQIFYPSGIKKREELYDQGKWIKGACYDTNGVEIKYRPYQSNASYIDGDIALQEKIQLEMSRTMKNAGDKFGIANLGNAALNGRVIVQFVIDKTGVMKDLKVIQSPNPDMNDKVINAIVKIRGWNPATKDGEYVDSIVTMPIVVFTN